MKTKGLGLLGFITSLSFLISLPLSAQVYQPEGINMPGTWNGWTNTNNAETMGAFRMKYRNIGGGQYTALINVQETGGNTTAGNYSMLFTSGPDANLYSNKWANTTLALNSSANLVFGGSNDNQVSLENGFYYTFIYDDKGYADTRVSMMRTSGIPISIDSVLGVPKSSVVAGEAVPISVKLSDVKSSQERIFIVYSSDDFTTNEVLEITNFDGTTTGSVAIPGQANGVTVLFYVLSTTVDQENWGGIVEHFTLNQNTNSGANYSISFGSLATLLTPANNAQQLEPTVNFTWSAIESVTEYRLQLSNDTDASFESTLLDSVISATSLTVPETLLGFNTTYRWRVKANSEEASWTTAFRFKTRATIEYANTSTGFGVINFGDSLAVEGQAYIPEITQSAGATAELTAWIGISNSNTSPANWDNSAWREVPFSKQTGNNDVFTTSIGKELPNGTYYFAFRFQYKSDGFTYGGYNSAGGGFWNGSTNVNGILTVTQVPVLIYPASNEVNMALKPTFSWKEIENARYDIQVTTLADAGFSSPIISQNNIADTTFLPANDLASHTSYAWRLRVSGENPGPYSAPKTFKTRGTIGFQNLQFVENDTLIVGNDMNAYAQIYIQGYTTQVTQAPGVQAWIGVFSENTNPSTWPDSVWTVAVLNEGSLTANNDEFSILFGSDLSLGTYYVASKFVYLNDEPVFGGYSENGGGVWSETHSNFVFTVIQATSNENESLQKPSQLILHQNFPNPFNPSTTIRFELEKSEQVSLSVYDILGRKVQSLINKTLQSGNHSVQFNASNLGSGTYLIRLETATQTLTKAAVLIK